jgi:hypothetical protein
MLIESFVGLCYEAAVKSLLAAARLVSSHQKDGVPFRVEREGDAPDTVRRVKAQLFHIRVTRTFERIDAWSAELRAKLLQQ